MISEEKLRLIQLRLQALFIIAENGVIESDLAAIKHQVGMIMEILDGFEITTK